MKIIFSLLSVLFLSNCVTRSQVEGELFFLDQLPSSACAQNPELRTIGIYRVLKCPNQTVAGCEQGEESYIEGISYCSVRMKEFLSASKVNVESWLKQLSKPNH